MVSAGWPLVVGGLPWQVVQASVPAVTQVGVAAVPLPPAKLPWQYVAEHEAPGPTYAAGVAPLVLASEPNTTWVVPSACCVEVGTGWHSEQPTGFDRLPFTCTWCTPTPAAVVALLFFESTGGAAFTFASAPVT